MTVDATVDMTTQPIAPEDEVRAHLYTLLGNLLLQVPDQSTLDQLSALQGDTGEVGSAINTLSQLAKSMTADAVEREYNILFIGVGRGEVLPLRELLPYRLSPREAAC